MAGVYDSTRAVTALRATPGSETSSWVRGMRIPRLHEPADGPTCEEGGAVGRIGSRGADGIVDDAVHVVARFGVEVQGPLAARRFSAHVGVNDAPSHG